MLEDPDGRQAVEGDENQTKAEQFEELGLIDPSAGTANAAATFSSAMSNEVSGMAEEGYKAVAGGAGLGLLARGARWAKSFFGRGTPSGAASQKVLDKANHVFGPKSLEKHNLGGFLDGFKGDQVKALNAIQKPTQGLADSGKISGVFESSVSVRGVNLTVRGKVIDGVVNIGTAYVP